MLALQSSENDMIGVGLALDNARGGRLIGITVVGSGGWIGKPESKLCVRDPVKLPAREGVKRLVKVKSLMCRIRV